MLGLLIGLFFGLFFREWGSCLIYLGFFTFFLVMTSSEFNLGKIDFFIELDLVSNRLIILRF